MLRSSNRGTMHVIRQPARIPYLRTLLPPIDAIFEQNGLRRPSASEVQIAGDDGIVSPCSPVGSELKARASSQQGPARKHTNDAPKSKKAKEQARRDEDGILVARIGQTLDDMGAGPCMGEPLTWQNVKNTPGHSKWSKQGVFYAAEHAVKMLAHLIAFCKTNAPGLLQEWIKDFQKASSTPTSDPIKEMFPCGYPAKDYVEPAMHMMTPIYLQKEVLAEQFHQNQLDRADPSKRDELLKVRQIHLEKRRRAEAEEAEMTPPRPKKHIRRVSGRSDSTSGPNSSNSTRCHSPSSDAWLANGKSPTLVHVPDSI